MLRPMDKTNRKQNRRSALVLPLLAALLILTTVGHETVDYTGLVYAVVPDLSNAQADSALPPSAS